MKTRAVLVGGYNNNKLFYLLTPHGENKLDGALVSPDGKVDYVPFFQFITTTSNVKEYKFSKFHRFLWNPAPRNEDRNKWSRLFLSKTQPVDDELLVGVKIFTELSPKEQLTKSVAERADVFRRKMANPTAPHMERTILNRSYAGPLRHVIGIKALGPSLRTNVSIDGDGDGFVNDGLPTMRPFIPGFDLVPDDIGQSSSMRSIRTNRADTAEERSISKQSMMMRVQDMVDHVGIRHNGGKPIRTKSDAMKVLGSIVPGFLRTDRGRSYIDFLDSMDSEDILHPWQQAYISQFVFMIEDEPLRNSVRWKISRLDQELIESGTSGQTSAPRRTTGWKRISPSLQVSGTPQRFRPSKMYDAPGIEVQYSQSDDFNDPLMWGWMLRPDKKNYNVLSAAISKEMNRQLRKTANIDDVRKIAPLVLGQTTEKITALSQFISQLPIPKSFPVGLAAQMNSNFAEIVNGTLPMVISVVDAINDIDSSVLGLDASDVQQFIMDSDLDEFRNTLDQIALAAEVLQHRDSGKQLIQAVKNVSEEWSPIIQSQVGVHEMTHALHFLRMRNEIDKRARAIRETYIEQLNAEFKQRGEDLPDRDFLENELPLESFYIDVFKQNLASFASSNPREFKRRLLYWSMAERGLLPRVDLESDGVTPRPGVDSMLPFYLTKLATAERALSAFLNNNGPNPASNLGFSAPISKREAQEIVDSLSSVLDSQIYFGQEPILMNEAIATMLNTISRAIGDRKLGRTNKAGDILTPYQVMSVLGPHLLRFEASSQRNDFRGATLGTSPSLPSSFILDTLGYPDLKLGLAGRVDGLTSEDAKPLADAIIGMGPMMDRIHSTIALVKPTNQIEMIESVTGQDIPGRPNEVLLPPSFARAGITTLDDLDNAPIETLINAANMAVDSVGENWYSQSVVHQSPGLSSGFFELLPNAVLELAPFSEVEKQKLREISGRIGLPASPGSIIRNDSPGYSSYQATLTSQVTVLSSEGFSLAEFAAETGLSEMLGIPLAQVIQGGNATREMTNEELQLVTRYMLWILGGRLPGDKLETFSEVPR